MFPIGSISPDISKVSGKRDLNGYSLIFSLMLRNLLPEKKSAHSFWLLNEFEKAKPGMEAYLFEKLRLSFTLLAKEFSKLHFVQANYIQ